MPDKDGIRIPEKSTAPGTRVQRGPAAMDSMLGMMPAVSPLQSGRFLVEIRVKTR